MLSLTRQNVRSPFGLSVRGALQLNARLTIADHYRRAKEFGNQKKSLDPKFYEFYFLSLCDSRFVIKPSGARAEQGTMLVSKVIPKILL